MLYDRQAIELISHFLASLTSSIPIVVDPVMVSTSGDKLLLPDAVKSLKDHLLPLASIVTSNLLEAASLVGMPASVPITAIKILSLGSEAVMIKGGHTENEQALDYFLNHNHQETLIAKRIKTANTHGTGCTLSAAITANLARGLSLIESAPLLRNI